MSGYNPFARAIEKRREEDEASQEERTARCAQEDAAYRRIQTLAKEAGAKGEFRIDFCEQTRGRVFTWTRSEGNWLTISANHSTLLIIRNDWTLVMPHGVNFNGQDCFVHAAEKPEYASVSMFAYCRHSWQTILEAILRGGLRKA